MDIFDLAAKITLDSSEYEKGVENAKGKLSGLGSALGTAAKVGGAAMAAIGGAALSAGGALAKSAGDVANYGDNIDKMSQKMGISIESYQEWDAVMQHSGTSIESLQSSMKTLASAVETGKDSFDALGISQEQLAEMNQEQIFDATIRALQNVESDTQRTYLAGQLLGRGATELGALLNMSAEETDEMRQRVHELGGVMSTDAVKASAKYADSLQDMKTAFKGVTRGIVSDFLPDITSVMDGLTELFSGGNGVDQITEGIASIAEKVSVAVPKIFDVIAQTIPGLVDTVLPAVISAGSSIMTSFVAALPSIIQILVDQIPSFVDGLIQMIDIIPQMVKVGQQAVLSLVKGMSGNIDKIIPAVTETIIALTEIMTDPDVLVDMVLAGMEILEALITGILQALPQILDAAIQATDKFISGLIQRFPELIDRGKEMLTNIFDGIVAALTLMLEAAAQILAKIGEGIANGVSKLKEKGRDMVNAIRDGIMEKINAAKEWGADLISNFIGGITEKWNNLKETVSSVAGTIKDFLGFSEPKKGPLSNFHTYAPDMMDLFAKGIRENEHVVTDQIEKSFNFGTRTIDFAASASGISSAGMINAVGSTNRDSNVTLYANLVTPDGKNLATFMLSDLIEVARANGTPIANPA